MLSSNYKSSNRNVTGGAYQIRTGDQGVADITMEKDQSIFSHQYGQTRNNFKMMV